MSIFLGPHYEGERTSFECGYSLFHLFETISLYHRVSQVSWYKISGDSPVSTCHFPWVCRNEKSCATRSIIYKSSEGQNLGIRVDRCLEYFFLAVNLIQARLICEEATFIRLPCRQFFGGEHFFIND